MAGIKDMKMPKNCMGCKLFHFYFDLDGAIHDICKYGDVEMCGDLNAKRNDICPLIEKEKESIPYLMHKEMGIPLSECQKAYDVALEYLRSKAEVKG